MFLSQAGDRWICQSAECGAEFLVVSPSAAVKKASPRCCCGSEMVRRYTAPAVRKLDPEETEGFFQNPDSSQKTRVNRTKLPGR
jgi:hypothetical protein